MALKTLAWAPAASITGKTLTGYQVRNGTALLKTVGVVLTTTHDFPDGSIYNVTVRAIFSDSTYGSDTNIVIVNLSSGDTTPPAAITNLTLTDNAALAGESPELIVGGVAPWANLAAIDANWTRQNMTTASIVTFDGQAGVLQMIGASGHHLLKQAVAVEQNTDYYLVMEAHNNNVAGAISIRPYAGDVEASSLLIANAMSIYWSVALAGWGKTYAKFNSGANTFITFTVQVNGTATAYLKSLSVIKYS